MHCPQHGSLAVKGGRDIAPLINKLLALPFKIKVASKDYHPEDHVSFSTMHPGKESFKDRVTITNPSNSSETRETTLWPPHCIQGTSGANIISEIDSSKLDVIVTKGLDKRTEMYSMFSDMFGNRGPDVASEDVATLLKGKGITHVYTVGLTGDCCVMATALDAAKEGFQTIFVLDATKSVDEGEKKMEHVLQKLKQAGVSVVNSGDPEMDGVWSMGQVG